MVCSEANENIMNSLEKLGLTDIGFVGTRVIEAVFQPPMHLRKPFQPLKDIGTSLPSPEKAFSFNSSTTVTLATGCYWVSSIARSFVRWDGVLDLLVDRP